ncbi:hydrogen peroxide-dependent heme synthase [Virgibacillus sp. W0430]|uniref:hydrogen peroxide-dependent heme synthase n=1 Tax=Virgibacillus sp. W0430 TaxID=3391580 RepID=UPI003F4752B5
MVEAVETFDGWYCLHDMRTIDWTSWKLASEAERHAARVEFEQLIEKWENTEKQKEGSHAHYKVVGQKADILFMFLRPTVEELVDLETELNKTLLADYMVKAHSYVSVVEISRYQPEKEGIDYGALPEIQERLYPTLPKWEYISFYPMNRRREGEENWYTLEKRVRGKLLYEHSKTGRKYAGKIKQIITGSIGFDDWEWGVTLFAHDVLELKKIVYEMRFDEVSSRYGEFGYFFIGNKLEKSELAAYLYV